jgi:hypothetical protein
LEKASGTSSTFPEEEETEETKVTITGRDDSMIEDKVQEEGSNYDWVALHEEAEANQEPTENENQPRFVFLKRKSHNLAPSKPKVKAAKRIDCWSSR